MSDLGRRNSNIALNDSFQGLIPHEHEPQIPFQ